MTRFQQLLCATTVLTVSGCTSSMGRMAVLAPRNVTVPGAKTIATVEGQDCGAAAMAADGSGSLQRAIEQALARAPGANALADVEISHASGCLTVRGKAVTMKAER